MSTSLPEICVFDRAAVTQRRIRSARHFKDHDFLLHRVLDDIADRLRDVRRDFPDALLTGARDQDENLKTAARSTDFTVSDCDEENLPFAPHRFDLIISPLSLHTINDLPGALIQMRRTLKPDGLFIGALFGGETLHELRASLMQAEINISGGVSPRIAPMAGRQDLAALMQRAGFSLPVVDAETVTVMYNDIFHLMHDLRGMGETNTITNRRKNMTGRKLFAEADKIYKDQFGEPDGKIPATFEIIYLNGWSPHESQQKPLQRGSAEKSLAEVLE